MSSNHVGDADGGWRAAPDHREQPKVAVIKHANPCGTAVGESIAEAHAKAHATDLVSAFGGVIAANQTVTEAMARKVAEVFTKVILAHGYESGALEVLTTKTNIRILTLEGEIGRESRRDREERA